MASRTTSKALIRKIARLIKSEEKLRQELARINKRQSKDSTWTFDRHCYGQHTSRMLYDTGLAIINAKTELGHLTFLEATAHG